jgi:hypothetical protein
MGAVMNREETPIWIKRRMKRHLANGRDDKALIRLLVKKARPRHRAEYQATSPDNIIVFPGVVRLRMEERKIA